MTPGRFAVPMPKLTRRGLAARLGAAAATISIVPHGAGATAVMARVPAPDPVARDAMLRGLALAGHRGDAVAAQAARAVMARLADTDPEGALLARLYCALDVRPAQYWRTDAAPAGHHDLTALHGAIAVCQPVSFGYTDLNDATSQRIVQPLALVHPPQGVKLLAWCTARQDFRQFFVRAIRDLTPLPGDFTDDRMALLSGLVAKERA